MNEIIEQGDPLRSALDMNSPSGLPRVPEGSQLVSERTLFGDVVTAQSIKVPRDEARILKRIDVMASAAGEAWFYRFPVRDRGRIKYIEGPSIDCCDAVSRYYGNCQIASAVQDMGNHWIIHSRFVDLETGYTLIRPFMQSKAGSRLGGDDDDRRMQIALGIGTSKSQRNVIDHALRDFTARAFDQAKKNLVERVGLKLDEYRARCIERIQEYGPDMLGRVERVYGRVAAQWLAPDVARIITELRDITNGMTTIDEAWPMAAPAEPRRSDVGSAAPPHLAAEQPEGTAQSHTQPRADAGGAAPNSTAPPEGSTTEGTQPAEPKNWRIGDSVMGQQAFTKALDDLLSMTGSDAEIDELLQQNNLRIAKLTGQPMQQWIAKVRQRREQIRAGGGDGGTAT
jgi:hypothetical protein